MTASPVNLMSSSLLSADSITLHPALLNGEILLETRSHSAWGGAVTAQTSLATSNGLFTLDSVFSRYHPQ
jgi:hypothetical protein